MNGTDILLLSEHISLSITYTASFNVLTIATFDNVNTWSSTTDICIPVDWIEVQLTKNERLTAYSIKNS